MNNNPSTARKAKAEKRRNALIPAMQAIEKALSTASSILDSGQDATTKLKAVHAVSQAAACYARLYEVGELESRLEVLEANKPAL